MVVLSSLEGEGGGLFMSADTPSMLSHIGILHHFRVLLLHVLIVVVVCPLSLLHVPCCHCVSLLCCCPLPSSLLSHDVVAVPSL